MCSARLDRPGDAFRLDQARISGKPQCGRDYVPEQCARRKYCVRVIRTLEQSCGPTQVAIEREHLVHVWIAACRSGDLQHADDDMPNVAAVNIGVTAVQVAEGTREAVRDTLEEDVAVAIAVQLGERAGQTKLERGVSRP